MEIPLIGFTGVEGSGKSTQAKLAACRFGLRYLSTGDTMRTLAKNDLGEMGDACRLMFEKHVYLSPQQTLSIIGMELAKPESDNGVALDGGFRTLEETELFGEMLKNTGKNFRVRLFHLRLPEWQASDRLLNGRKRSDDTPESLFSRLRSYHTNLGERMAFARDHWDFNVIDARGVPEEVADRIARALH